MGMDNPFKPKNETTVAFPVLAFQVGIIYVSMQGEGVAEIREMGDGRRGLYVNQEAVNDMVRRCARMQR